MADDDQISPEDIFTECNNRLDLMINGIVLTARDQGAGALGPIDLVRIKNTFDQKISDFMLRYLAATAVVRLVNDELADPVGLNT